MSTMHKFWIVWSPTGTRPPSRRHDTEESARTEAERLAALAPGAEFFVCATIGVAKVSRVEWSFTFYPKPAPPRLAQPDPEPEPDLGPDIPF